MCIELVDGAGDGGIGDHTESAGDVLERIRQRRIGSEVRRCDPGHTALLVAYRTTAIAEIA